MLSKVIHFDSQQYRSLSILLSSELR